MNLVIFDVDGVVCNFEEKIVAELCRQFGQKGALNRHYYRLEDRFKHYPEILRKALELANDPNFYYGLNPISDGIRFSEELHLAGYAIMFLSSRPFLMKSFTDRWLGKNVPFLEKPSRSPGQHVRSYKGKEFLHCGVENKAEFLEEITDSIEFVVEDSPRQIESLKDAGIPVLCWSQEWNEGIFPRLYVSKNGILMLWVSEDEEAAPFWNVS